MPGFLSPWDSLAYFDRPRESSTSWGPGTVLVVPANPRRVFLLLCNSGPAAVTLHLSPSFPAGQGIPLPVGISLSFNHHDSGPLVQAEWYGDSLALGNTVTFIEVCLSKWPQETNIGG